MESPMRGCDIWGSTGSKEGTGYWGRDLGRPSQCLVAFREGSKGAGLADFGGRAGIVSVLSL